MAVMQDPAVAPAAPNVATVHKFGYDPRELTWAMTSKPKLRFTQSE